MSQQPKVNGPKLRFSDRPEVHETFADSVRSISYDGQTLRLAFCVTRMDDEQSGPQVSGQQIPVARLVLSPRCIKELMDNLKGLRQNLQRAAVTASAGGPAN